jgi:hypothetical protein
MHFQDRSKEAFLATSLNWAKAIADAGEAVDRGQNPANIDLDIFDVDLTMLLFSLRQAGFNTLGASASKKATPEQIEKIAEILGPESPRFDKLLEANHKIRGFIAKKAWAIMAGDSQPTDNRAYKSFHVLISEIGIDPRSDEILTFLGDLSREDFERIDQPHALNSIYVEYMEVMDPRIFMEALLNTNIRARQSDTPIDVYAEFERRSNMIIDDNFSDMELTIGQSNLTEAQVIQYLALRDERIAKSVKTVLYPEGQPHFVDGPKGLQ